MKTINECAKSEKRVRRQHSKIHKHTQFKNNVPALLISIFSLFTINCFAATKTFTGPGIFSNATLWDLSTLPTAGDSLQINGACTFDNAASNFSYGPLNIGFTIAGSIIYPVGTANTLSVTNVYSTIPGSTLNMTNGGILIIQGTWVAANCTFTPGTGTIEIQSSITLPAAYPVFYNLNINGAIIVNTGINTTINSNLLIIAGTFNSNSFNNIVIGMCSVSGIYTNTTAGIKSYGSLSINGGLFNATNRAITINGNMVNNGTFIMGTGRVTFTGATSNTVTGTAANTSFSGGITVNKGVSQANVIDVQCIITLNNGGLTLTNGAFELSSVSTVVPFTSDSVIPTTAKLWCNGGIMNQTASFDWTLNGYLKVSAGTINFGAADGNRLSPTTTTPGTGTIEVSAGNLNVTGRISDLSVQWTYIQSGGITKLATIGNSTFFSSGRHVFNMDNLNCSFSMSAGLLIIERSAGFPSNQNLGYHNISTLGTGFTGGTLQMGDASTPVGNTMRVETSIPVYNLTINSANAVVQIQSPGSPVTTFLTVRNNLDIAAGVLDVNAGSKDLYVGGIWSNESIQADPFIQGVKTVTFNGAAPQGISNTGNANGTVFNSVTINNSTVPLTVAIVALGTPITVNGLLTLTRGYMVTTLTNILNMTAGSSTIGTSANSYVSGPMTKTGTTGFIFPVGSSDLLKWARIEIGAPSASTTFTAQYFNNPYVDVSTMAAAPLPVLNNVSVMEYWNLDRTAGAGNATVKLYWENAAFSGIFDCTTTDLRVAHWNGSAWENNINTVATTGTCVGASAGTVATTTPELSSYSPFTFGSLTGTNPLPIELLSFTALPCENYVCLNWSTATETNNDYFTIEKTKDGNNYDFVSKINGAGNSVSQLNYSSIDSKPFQGISYYHVKQTDFNGVSTTSNIVSVNFILNTDFSFSIFPNPGSADNINLEINATEGKQFLFQIYDVAGREIFSKMITVQNNGQNIYSMYPSLNSTVLTSGFYLIKATFGESVYCNKLIVN